MICMDRQETKQNLRQAGSRWILLHGYNHTGLNEILAEAGVPKGSFYYYFTSKEDFGLQVLDQFAARSDDLHGHDRVRLRAHRFTQAELVKHLERVGRQPRAARLVARERIAIEQQHILHTALGERERGR